MNKYEHLKKYLLEELAMYMYIGLNPFTHTFFPENPYFLPFNVFLGCCVAKLHYVLLEKQYFTFQLNFLLVSMLK